MEPLTLELRDRKGQTLPALIDQEDLHLLGPYTWRICPVGYVHRKCGDQFIYLHRVIMGAAPGTIVDHINGNRTDNRRSNLRLCTHAQNVRNMRLPNNSSTGFKGVCRRGENHWTARIGANNRTYYLGVFKDPREAAHAYNRAAILLHGEFARLNPI